MPRRWNKWTLCQTALVAAACLTGSRAPAQQPCLPPTQQPCLPYPSANLFPAPGNLTAPPGSQGVVAPPGGGGAAAEGGGAAAGSTAFTELASGAGVGTGTTLEATPSAYIDGAIPKTMFRLRYDDAQNINRPDRAEFIYATWKEISFHPHGILKNGRFQGTRQDPNAQGPVQSPGQLNMQDITGYLEYAFSERLSVFADVPVRFLHFHGIQEGGDQTDRNDQRVPALHEGAENNNPSNTPNGLSDVEFGFKYALLADPDRYLTFQYRTYAPTGDPRTGLGTGHWSLEPGLLYYQRRDRLVFQGQVEDWIPVGGGPFEGNVLIYGAGLGIDVYRRGNLRVMPITEFVGWTVLGGYESFFTPGTHIATPPGTLLPAGLSALPGDHGVISAAGDTIVNGKIGLRTYFGSGSDIYFGWGRALTGERWYKDIYRVEYRNSF